MAIDRIQNQTAFTQRPNVAQHSANVNMERLVYLPRKHYKNHNEIPNSVNMIKPEPGQGHLLNGGLFGSIGRFFSNRIYDIKSVYRGYKGTANDHQLGRTNDVGLVLGGLGIASFLTTKRIATMPKHMEFIGLASFLASMALWPKIGIFGPARLVHGFDADKRYIDDQGRNKSVFQDPNYIPFDLYRGKKKSENLSAIADYMGIDRDADNREEIVKDQMKKIATQNHTLWMLTSGPAVPTLTALMCNAFERGYEPFIVKQKASKHDKMIDELYKNLIENPQNQKEETFITKIKKAFTKDKVTSSINKFTAMDLDKSEKIITKKELTNFINTVTEGAGAGVSNALAKDLSKILATPDKTVIDSKYIETLAKNIETKFQGHKLLKNGIISFDEITEALTETIHKKLSQSTNDANTLDKEKIKESLLKNRAVNKKSVEEAIIQAVKAKLEKSGNINSSLLKRIQQMAAADIKGTDIIPSSDKIIMTREKAEIINSLTEPFKEYLTNFIQLRKINNLKMGDIADSQNAYFWKQLEKTFTNIVQPNNVITSRALKPLVDNEEAIKIRTKENLEKLVKNDDAYKRAVAAISTLKDKYLAAMLGEGRQGAYTNFVLGGNNGSGVAWNLRTFSSQGTEMDKFIELQSKIASNFRKVNHSFENLINIIAGNSVDYTKSIASLETSANVTKVENFVTACDRLIHTLDIYKRADGYAHANDWTQYKATLLEEAKINVISAEGHDFFAKFNNVNKPDKFRNYMQLIYDGYLLDETKSAMSEASKSTLTAWLKRTHDVMGMAFKDAWQYCEFVYPSVSTDNKVFDNMTTTPFERFKLQGKNPVELLNQGFKNSYNSNKWLRTFGGLFTCVLGFSILAQFFFGKKDSTIPLEKNRIARLRREQNETLTQNTTNESVQKLEMEAANGN